MHKIATVFRIKFSIFMLVLFALYSFQAVALTCPNGYHSNETNITDPEQECFTTVTGGKYITHGSLPADFDSSENGTGIRYHGYGDSNDDTLDENTFATVFPSKTIYGDSACRPQDNPYGAWNTVTDWDFERGNEGGGYICWCRLNGENDPLGLYTYKSKWVARGPVESNDCWKDCAQDCAIITGNVMGWPDSSPKSSLFSNVNIITEDCPAGSYCPGGEVNYGSVGIYECPANSSSTSGQTSCVCDVRYATENGQGATQDNPCVELTGAASCISGAEYWDEVNQECVEKTEDYTFVFNSGKYLPPVYDVSSTGYKCHKSRSVTYCDDDSLIENLPNNSWLVHFDLTSGVNFVGRSACSDIGGSYKDLSSVAFDSDIIYGSNCWCKATTPFGSTKWILSGTFENGDICANECAGNCGDHFSWDNDFKKVLLSTVETNTTNCDAGYYCPGGEYSVLNTTPSHKSCPETYPDSATGAYKIDQCFATISFESNGGTAVESQTFNYDEEITQYSLSEIPVSTRDDYTFVGWYEDSAFTGTPVTTETSFDTSTTLYAKWGCPSGYTGTTDTITDSGTQCRKACDHIVGKTNTGGYKYYNGDQSSCTYTTAVYTIRYVDEDGNALTTTNPTTWTFGETQPFDLTDPEIPEGWLFNAWYTDNLIYQDNGFGNKVTTITEDLVTRLAGTGTTITIYGYRYPEPVFWMTTTQMNAGDLFSFVVRIAGDVWVDWDDGYISKIKNLQHWRWLHNYKNAGVYRIGVVSKNVTDYTKSNENTYDSEDSCAAHIYSSFYITNCWTDGDGGTTPLKLAKIEGKLGDVLPTLENGKNANFTDAFCGCENLTGTIPDGFFDKITGQPTLMMFWGTFKNTKLSGKIPDGLFGGLDGEYTGSLFESTFYNTNISGPIPENMFGKLHGAPKKCMFSSTFNNTSISGPIPENLFGRIEGAPAYSMFSQTFWQCPNLSGEIPENLFGNLYGAPAYAMFSNTFDRTNLSGPIPQDLFKNISGPAKPWMYNRTFAMSPGLTGNITEGFFGTITGPMQEYTFNRTFLGDSNLTGPIPENLFGEVSGTSLRGFYETFKGATNIGKDENGNATPIPVNLFKNISGEVNSTNEMFNGTFEDTQYLTSPVPTELFKGITGFLEDNATGTRTSTYTSGGMKNIFNNSNIPTVCDAGQYQYLTGFEVDWNGRVACEICPENFPDSTSGDNMTINKCYTVCPADEHGGTYVSGHKYWTSDGVGDTSSCTYKYNISYDLGNVDASLTDNHPTEYTSAMSSNLTVPFPEYGEYISFDGWFNNSELQGDAISEIPVGSVGDIKLYAKWSRDEFNVIYDYTNGGSGCANEKYSFGVEKNITCVPEYTGHMFVGWFDEPINGNQVSTLSNTATGDVTLYARWTENVCNNNQYLDVSSNSCKSCPDNYTLSDNQATAPEQCYKQCSTDDFSRSLTVIGKDYYGNGIDTCEVTSCETGSKPKASVLDLTTLIGFSESGIKSVFKSNDGTSNNSDISDLTAYGITDNGEFVVDFDSKGKIHGYARCSKRAASSPWVGTDYAFVLQSDGIVENVTDELNQQGAQYCYCMLDGYTPANSVTQIGISAPWVFNGDRDYAATCASYCAYNCADAIQRDHPNLLPFRAAMFNSLGTPGPASCEIENYTITLNLNDGVYNGDTMINYTVESDTIVMPTNLTKSGYTFGGWFLENNDFITQITEIPHGSTGDVTLYAKWIMCDACDAHNGASCELSVQNNTCIYTTSCPKGYDISGNETSTPSCTPETYTITYETNGGNNYSGAPENYTIETETITLGTPTKAGNVFTGWYLESTFETPISKIEHGSTGDITLYAQWEPGEFNVIYDYTNGGAGCANEKYSFGVEKNITCIPEYTGYIFTGWFDEPTNGNKVITIPNTSTGDITLYAQWTPMSYYIEYVLNGGTNYENAPNAYTYGFETLIDGTPTKKDFLFDGWCTDEELTQCYDTYTISNTSVGKVILYIKWKFNCETNKWLHIGENENDKICLSDTKPDGLAVAVQTDVSTYYIPLYNDDLHINKDSTKTMRILYKNKEYSVHDKSVQ